MKALPWVTACTIRRYGREAAAAPGLSGPESPPLRRHSHTAMRGEPRLSAMLRQEPHLLDSDEYVELWLVPRIMKGELRRAADA